MDDLDYFPEEMWPADAAAYPAYAAFGEARPGGGYYGAQPTGAQPTGARPAGTRHPGTPPGGIRYTGPQHASPQYVSPQYAGPQYAGTAWQVQADAPWSPSYGHTRVSGPLYAPLDSEELDDPRYGWPDGQAARSWPPSQQPWDAAVRQDQRDGAARPRRPRDPGTAWPPEPDGTERRSLSGTSLIAGYAPEAAPRRRARDTAERAEPQPRTAQPKTTPSYGKTLPEWLPFGSRLVLLPKETADDGSTREHRDVNGGWLRPAVFGAMDGLVTNSSLIAGVGGGGGGHGAIVLTGIAGLIAGAFSMATGEYISVKSQNELTEAEVDLERRQHARDRKGKLDRLTRIFIDKGVSPNLAEAVARQISADPERAVETHVREELGLDPDDLPSPKTAAVASLTSFTVGALIPLSPFLVGVPSLPAALVLAGLFAFTGGAAVARLTGRPSALGGLRQFAAAFLATGMAFLIGHVIGGYVG